MARKEDADVSENVPSLASIRWTTDGKMRELHGHLEVFCRAKIIPFTVDLDTSNITGENVSSRVG
jgi:hypothetical protein